MDEQETNHVQLERDIRLYVHTLDLYERTISMTEGHVPQVKDVRRMLEEALSRLRDAVDLANQHRRALEEVEEKIPGLLTEDLARRRAELDARLNELKAVMPHE